MASIIKLGEKWRAQVRKKGFPTETRTFETKAKAKIWAEKTEADMVARKYQDVRILTDMTLGSLIDRYQTEIGKIKKFGRTKAATLLQIKAGLGHILLLDLTTDKLTEYAMWMIARGTGGVTIATHLSYINGVLTVAKKLWQMPVNIEITSEARARLTYGGISMKSKERKRRPTWRELDELMLYFYTNFWQIIPMHDLIAFAATTAMRQGEIVRITWDDLNTIDKTVIIRDRKHPTQKQGNDTEVPLLGESFDIVMRQARTPDPRIFPFDARSVSAAFTRTCRTLKIDDLTFHDLRHEGVSRMFEQGYTVEQVALVSGHRDWKMLARYTQIKAKDLHFKTVTQANPMRLLPIEQ